MLRFLAVILILQLLFAGFARAIDLHDSIACSDSTQLSTPAGDGREPPDQRHAGSCCFGSLFFGANSQPLTMTVQASIGAPAGPRRDPDLEYYTSGPERPPRA